MKADHNRHNLAQTQTAISYAGRLRHRAFFFAVYYPTVGAPTVVQKFDRSHRQNTIVLLE
ncbi:MAG: hypothetical protein V7K89_11900 [Nostoc sp.]